MKIIFIDTETTGFNHNMQEIFQISGLVTENRKVLESFNIFSAPKRVKCISNDALKVTGKTIDELLSYPPSGDGYFELKSILDKYVVKGEKRYILAGQNVKGFDWRFLCAFWNSNKSKDDYPLEYYFNKNICYDLMELTRPLKKANIINVPNIKLGTIMEAFNIQVRGTLHNALTDIFGTFDSFYSVTDVWLNLFKTDNTFVLSNASNSVKYLLNYEIENKKG